MTGYLDALHPAVLFLVKQVVEAAHSHGKFTGVCGEVAGDLLAVPILVGLGVDELSMTPAIVPQVENIIRELDQVSTSSLAKKALVCTRAEDVRRLIRIDLEGLKKSALWAMASWFTSASAGGINWGR